MNRQFFTDIPVVELKETFHVGVSFENDYGGNATGAHVVVTMMREGGSVVVVASG